jgi:hypothetical protein
MDSSRGISFSEIIHCLSRETASVRTGYGQAAVVIEPVSADNFYETGIFADGRRLSAVSA